MTIAGVPQAAGLNLGSLGFGAMGLSSVYGRADRDESLRTLRRAIDRGIRLIDTADVYGGGDNERLVGEAITGRRDDVVIATKIGLVGDPQGGEPGFRGDPAYVRSAAEASLRRLNVDVIDLLYLHRPDPATLLEVTVGAMGELVSDGLVHAIGLCEVSGDQLRAAAQVFPISALQSEWSLFAREIEQTAVPVAAEIGAAVVPFSPLGRGALLDTATLAMLDDGDFRRMLPWFDDAYVGRNRALVEVISGIAHDLAATPAQVALAWLRSRAAVFGTPVVPIPGTRRAARVDENLGALALTLSVDQIAELDSLAARVAGTRGPQGPAPNDQENV